MHSSMSDDAFCDAHIETACASINLTTGVRAKIWAFKNLGVGDENDHVLMVDGDFTEQAPLVRIHSSCITGDLYQAAQCDCGPQLEEAIQRISEEGGAIVYLHQEGRGIGLFNKMRAYQEKERGLDTYAANRVLGLPEDARNFDPAVKMLRLIGFDKIRLMTNNPRKAEWLQSKGIEVVETVSTGLHRTSENEAYLDAKQELGGHTFESS